MPKPTVPAQAGFIITVGVPLGKAHDPMCGRAIRVLQQAGYMVAPTSEDGMRAALSQIEAANQLAELDTNQETEDAPSD